MGVGVGSGAGIGVGVGAGSRAGIGVPDAEPWLGSGGGPGGGVGATAQESIKAGTRHDKKNQQQRLVNSARTYLYHGDFPSMLLHRISEVWGRCQENDSLLNLTAGCQVA